MNNTPMQDKELLDDVLSSEKMITGSYNTFANECATPGVRDTMQMCIRDSSHTAHGR